MHRLGWVVLVVLSTSLAHADAIEGPPVCPRGARPMASHAGSWCEDTTCSADADCRAGEHCETLSLCVPPGTRPTGPSGYDSGRGWTPSPGRRVSGVCGGSASCASGDVCDTARRCAR